MSGTFAIDPSKVDAVQTCLLPMCGVGAASSAGSIVVQIFAPFDGTRLDRVRAVIAAIDPLAVET